ncbi:hypothetical protein [Nocardia sp. NPDC057668]|uniref:hypothetical protein n=1 Tax=Nocardia sp. NPDC057668 TaxID=3346202 RepID=UPI003670DB1E
MSVLTALARIEATRSGRAQPIATVRHCHVARRPLVVIPLRMAGEAAAPLAVMVGSGPEDATVLIVPQPRDRQLRFHFTAELADIVLPYLSSFLADTETVTPKSGDAWERCLDSPQLWVPNQGGTTFLKLMGRSVRFRRADGPNPVPESVPLLGRWLTWFGDRAEHPGSSALLAMTSVLGGHWATGQSGMEDGNLAAQLGWIDPPAGSTGAQAAALAEDPIESPPAGPATDPGFDNEELAPLLTAYDTAIDDDLRVLAGERIRHALEQQLAPTWRLMWRAIDLLRAMPAGASVAARWDGDRSQFSRFHRNIPESHPQPRRDSPVPAVRRLLAREQAQQALDVQRAYDDPLVMAEYRLSGDAFRGLVVECDPTRLIVNASGKKLLRPEIRVHTTDPVAMAIGTELHAVESRGQKGRVLGIDGEIVTLELSGGMGNGHTAKPGSVPSPGHRLTFTGLSPSGFQRPHELPKPEDTPWTHGGPPPEWTPNPADAQEEWS